MNQRQSTGGNGTGTDPTAVVRVAQGDLKAMEELYDRYSGAVYALILRITGREAEAEELLQETFLQAWRDASRYEPSRGSVSAWLFTIARTRSIDALRARARRPVAQSPSEREGEEGADPLRDLVADGPGPEGMVLDKDLTTRIRAVMSQMPAPERQVLEYVYFEGMSHSEVAALTGWPMGTVKSRLARAMRSLREVLGAPSISQGDES